MRDWIKLKSLERELDKAKRRYAVYQQSSKYKKLSEEDKRMEFDVYGDAEYKPILETIEELKTKIFLKKAEKYGIPYQSSYVVQNEGGNYWINGEYGTYLTTKGYHELRKAIREEKKARREAVLCWTPLITVLTGLLGVVATVLSILRYWGK